MGKKNVYLHGSQEGVQTTQTVNGSSRCSTLITVSFVEIEKEKNAIVSSIFFSLFSFSLSWPHEASREGRRKRNKIPRDTAYLVRRGVWKEEEGGKKRVSGAELQDQIEGWREKGGEAKQSYQLYRGGGSSSDRAGVRHGIQQARSDM